MFYPTGYNYGAGINNSLAQTDAANARSDARDALNATDLMRHDVDRLLMITEALWTLLKKEHGYTDQMLTDLVNTIDLRDGKLDGRVADSPPKPCPKCGKINSRKRNFCIYCGNPLPTSLFGG
ncbi:MAG TPA: zinc ribbon domain-containing protein [Verrucomicrobiae bacterium]|nr:zinc ribbon domain-containing protein [Verrucomicrobiae bacterium]